MTYATLNLDPSQRLAAEKISDWIRRPTPNLTLGGYAGTGKTTLLKELWPQLDKAGAVAISPTAKAAMVLSSKGVPAMTAHRLLYLFQGTRIDDRGNEQPIFEDRGEGSWGGDLDRDPRLLVCEEASMINDRLAEDIWARRLPVLWVGDHGQLAPVGGDPGLMRNPDIRLEKIHRTAADNPILGFAHKLRQGHEPTPKKDSAGEALKVGRVNDVRAVVKHFENLGLDRILVATNHLRHQLNRLVRSARKKEGILDVGDEIIITRNNYKYGLFNGQIALVESVEPDRYLPDEVLWVELSLETPTGWSKRVNQRYPILTAPFGNPDFRSDLHVPEGCRNHLQADYGYAITCHKSQGSEWSGVMVVESARTPFEPNRWRYTAATRAKERLVYILG